MSAPAYDLAAGQYRILGERRGVIQPGVELARPAAVEWYNRTIASRRSIVTRTRGKKRPRTITEERHYELTAGLVIGAGALVLGWEAAQSVAHGLAGLDPLTWASDIEAWVTGGEQKTAVASATVGGIIQSRLVGILNPPAPPAPPPTPSQTSTAPGVGGSGGSSSSSGNPCYLGIGYFDPITKSWVCAFPDV